MTVPDEVAGAEFVGNETCAMCHEEIVRGFHDATHAALAVRGPAEATVGCESCHGPGSLHFESGGEVDQIVNPRSNPETCYDCHGDVRGHFSLPNSHPVSVGPLGMRPARMACGDCHDPHTGSAAAFNVGPGDSPNAGCTECHTAQRGPFVFEHEAMREGCTACHAAHGSLNEAMLTESNATLCLKCHAQEQTRPGVVAIGGQDHSFFLSQGTCFSAGCHEAVHGSQVSSSLRF
jgi:DmsE family decaheme c-type cytochrome